MVLRRRCKRGLGLGNDLEELVVDVAVGGDEAVDGLVVTLVVTFEIGSFSSSFFSDITSCFCSS